MPVDIHTEIISKFVEQIETGCPPWRRPWSDQTPAIPHNAASKRSYQGINVLILWDVAAERGYSHRWATYRQWQALGNQVRRGESGTRIYYWRDLAERSRESSRHEQRIVFREHVVFAAEQCNDEHGHRIEPPPERPPFTNYTRAEELLAATQADIHFGGDRAYYSVPNDIIVVPFKHRFEGSESFYATMLHELAHWSGHPSRLNRIRDTAAFGSPEYAMEELVGEIASAFLTAELGIPQFDRKEQSASYLADWLPAVQDRGTAIFRAASQASRAANYLMSFSSKTNRVSSTPATA